MAVALALALTGGVRVQSAGAASAQEHLLPAWEGSRGSFMGVSTQPLGAGGGEDDATYERTPRHPPSGEAQARGSVGSSCVAADRPSSVSSASAVASCSGDKSVRKPGSVFSGIRLWQANALRQFLCCCVDLFSLHA